MSQHITGDIQRHVASLCTYLPSKMKVCLSDIKRRSFMVQISCSVLYKIRKMLPVELACNNKNILKCIKYVWITLKYVSEELCRVIRDVKFINSSNHCVILMALTILHRFSCNIRHFTLLKRK